MIGMFEPSVFAPHFIELRSAANGTRSGPMLQYWSRTLFFVVVLLLFSFLFCCFVCLCLFCWLCLLCLLFFLLVLFGVLVFFVWLFLLFLFFVFCVCVSFV